MVLTVLVWNFIVFFIYGIDKFKAVHSTRRLNEQTLVLCALLLGGIGALCGMEIFKHKTKHLNFKIVIPFAFVLTVIVLICLATIGI